MTCSLKVNEFKQVFYQFETHLLKQRPDQSVYCNQFFCYQHLIQNDFLNISFPIFISRKFYPLNELYALIHILFQSVMLLEHEYYVNLTEDIRTCSGIV